MTKTTLLQTVKNISVNALILLSSLLVALVLIEIILRFTPYKNITQRSYRYPANYFKADKEIGYDIVKNFKPAIHGLQEHPYEVFSNSYGCFDYERRIPDNYAIIVGDSFTWGYAPLDKKWTTYLEEKSNIFMLKCGITGHGTMQEMKKAKKVIKKIGKNPNYIIVLYTSNDFNDDFMFPNRTVIGEGKLVNKNKGANLITGERFFYNKQELAQKHKKYMGNNLSSYLRKIRYSLVTYKLFRNSQPKIKTKLREIFGKKTVKLSTKQKTNKMPNRTNGYYNVLLTKYFDQTDRKWYNQAVKNHENNIRKFAIYAKSINAKFLFIDRYGTLSHKRFDNLRKFFDADDDFYFYDLALDYKKQSTWKHDGHWDIKGNQEAGKYIYRHFRDVGVF